MLDDLLIDMESFFGWSHHTDVVVEEDPWVNMLHLLNAWMYWAIAAVSVLALAFIFSSCYFVLPLITKRHPDEEVDYWEDDEVRKYVQEKYIQPQEIKRRSPRPRAAKSKRIGEGYDK